MAPAAAPGVPLRWTETGEGPAVVLLHGFPDLSRSWRHQLPALAAAGFRAVAPEMRGYPGSPAPPDVAAYRVERLVEDVVALVARLGDAPVTLVGHDWGGIVAWYTAMMHPALVRRLAILNAPHPAAYRREIRRSSQALRSWYAAAFQVPRLPEAVLQARGGALLRWMLANGPADTPEEADAYVAAFSRAGALTGPLHYYRAAARHGLPRVRTVAAPTLVVWGERDPYLVPALASGLERWVPSVRVERLPEAGHWLHHEAPETVNRLLVAFARDDGPAAVRSPHRAQDGNRPGAAG